VPPSYALALKTFLDLRGKGVSVAAEDLLCLQEWSEQHISESFVLECLYSAARECAEKGRSFPLRIKSLHKSVLRAWAAQRHLQAGLSSDSGDFHDTKGS
jgi:hypothetical protein